MALEKFFCPDYYYSLNKSMRNDEGQKNGTLDNAYSFSNEIFRPIFKNLHNPIEKVLTVGSSGDQVINSLFYGANDITVIDANLYTKYWTDYKLAAIKNLSYDEFCRYFFNMPLCFSYYVYKKIFHDLDKDSKIFWGTIFQETNTAYDIYSRILARDDTTVRYVSSEFYLYDDCYKQLQQILKRGDYNLSYVNAEFEDFPNAISGDFDLILLSNIFDYVKNDVFSSVVNRLYKNNVRKWGSIQLQYDFDGYHSPTSLFPEGRQQIKYVSLNWAETAYMLQKPNILDDDYIA